MDNFRDDHLKINDDRKVRVTLSDFKDRRDMMILLTVRMNDLKGMNADKTQYDKAWYRLQNEDSNQTLDHSYIDKVKEENGIEPEDPEAENEPNNEESEGEDAGAKKETIFLAGRLYREDIELPRDLDNAPEGEDASEAPVKYKTKWIYERWNKVVTSE